MSERIEKLYTNSFIFYTDFYFKYHKLINLISYNFYIKTKTRIKTSIPNFL